MLFNFRSRHGRCSIKKAKDLHLYWKNNSSITPFYKTPSVAASALCVITVLAWIMLNSFQCVTKTPAIGKSFFEVVGILISEAVIQRCSVKNVFLKTSQNSQENIFASVSFSIKLHAKACNFIKKETEIQVFYCKFCEIFKDTFLQNTSKRLIPTVSCC